MQKEDRIQRLIDCIMQLAVPLEDKLHRLETLEPLIEEAYALGLTSVKPVRLMTTDNLVSRLDDDYLRTGGVVSVMILER